MFIANNFRPAWNLGFDTLTVYPDAHVETDTVDGQLYRHAVDETFATIRAGAGTLFLDSNANLEIVRVDASTTSNQYAVIGRNIILFDTSTIPDSNQIDITTLSLFGTTVGYLNTLSGEDSVNSKVVVVASTPASNTSLQSSDYGQLGSTDFGRSVVQSSLSQSAYNDITLNSDGRDAVSTTSITKYGTRSAWDFDNTTIGITWSSGGQQVYNARSADQAGTANDPKLVVQHSVGVSESSFLAMF